MKAAHPINAEPEFLLAALRRLFDPGAPAPNSETIDWAVLFKLAAAHAVTPALSHALRDVSIPAAIYQQLRSAVENGIARSLAQTAELACVAGLFEEQGIAAVALKGPLLSRYLYGDIGSRSSGDIDVLVKQQSVPKIRDILVSNGYQLTTTLHWKSNSAFLRSRENEISFVSPSSVSIDVHWSLVPSYYASAFDELDVWQSLKTESIAGRPIYTLAPEPLLLFLCAHGAKHMFERLGWICDIARFLIVSHDLDWSVITAHANRQLSLGIYLASDLLGAPLRMNLPKDETVERLAGIVRSRLLAGEIPPAPAVESNRFSLALLETRSDRLRYLLGLYVTPSEAEYRALSLPPWLFPLYYPYRPIRLFAKHVLGR